MVAHIPSFGLDPRDSAHFLVYPFPRHAVNGWHRRCCKQVTDDQRSKSMPVQTEILIQYKKIQNGTCTPALPSQDHCTGVHMAKK